MPPSEMPAPMPVALGYETTIIGALELSDNKWVLAVQLPGVKRHTRHVLGANGEDLALQASGLDHARVVHRPRLLSDNGPSYISSDLAEWLDKRNIGHVRGAPCHPQTQGKIERWH